MFFSEDGAGDGWLLRHVGVDADNDGLAIVDGRARFAAVGAGNERGLAALARLRCDWQADHQNTVFDHCVEHGYHSKKGVKGEIGAPRLELGPSGMYTAGR